MPLYNVVMFIDDDKEDQEIFVDAVKEVDPTVRCISEYNAEGALKKLSDHSNDMPDVIFLDMNMPKLNGKQLLAELKKTPVAKDIPVIMCSTFFGEKDIDEIKQLGAAHHMVKPTRFNELRDAISAILNRKW